jgi:hypothetical protein
LQIESHLVLRREASIIAGIEKKYNSHQRTSRTAIQDSPMRYRKLRIAWSVGCGIACVLLIVLWVRSYGDTDPIEFIGVPIWSLKGTLIAYDPVPKPMILGQNEIVLGNEWIELAIWQPMAGAIAFALVPWLRWRFSLRTLLIATTLIAIVLGVIAYAVGS